MANALSDSQAAIGMLLEEKYRLQKELGAGGMGQVFLAHHETIERDVAIKVLHRNLASNEEVRQRFETEARAIARLRHPNCVMLYEFGYSHQIGALFAVFEYVEGHSLEHWVGEKLPLKQVVEIGRQIAEGVEHAHNQKIIHRDLKPDNVMLVELEGGGFEIKILDFGIARITGDENDTRLTRQGQMFGTPPYMSPEQIIAKLDVTFATDLYSIGVLLYELIEGRLPFSADTPIEIVMMHLNEEVPPMEREGLPEELRQIVMRCLEKDPADRYKSAKELARALGAVSLTEESVEGAVKAAVPTKAARGVEVDGEEKAEAVERSQTSLVFPGAELVSGAIAAEEEAASEEAASRTSAEDISILLEAGAQPARSEAQSSVELETQSFGEGGQKRGLLVLLLLIGLVGFAGFGALVFGSSSSGSGEGSEPAEQRLSEAEAANEDAVKEREREARVELVEPVPAQVAKEEEESSLAMEEAEEPGEAEVEEVVEEAPAQAGRLSGAAPAARATERGRAGTGGGSTPSGGRPAQSAADEERGPASLSINRQRRQAHPEEAQEEQEAESPRGLRLQRRNRVDEDQQTGSEEGAREQPSRLSIPQRN